MTKLVIVLVLIFNVSVLSTQQKSSEEWFQKANKAVDDGKRELALEYYDNAINLQSDFYEAWYKNRYLAAISLYLTLSVS